MKENVKKWGIYIVLLIIACMVVSIILRRNVLNTAGDNIENFYIYIIIVYGTARIFRDNILNKFKKDNIKNIFITILRVIISVLICNKLVQIMGVWEGYKVYIQKIIIFIIITIISVFEIKIVEQARQ